MAPARLTLVIPARNEERLLPRLLDSIEIARPRLTSGEVEVVVADNVSTDRTAAIATARGCRVVSVETRVIAAVRNAGARVATAPILAFVDADSRIHPDTFVAIERALGDPRIVGGTSGVALERWSLGLACTYALLLPLILVLRMDTGVVFCRRADFEAIGGYDERRLFAEDVALLFALRALGRRRRARLARLTAIRAVASVRKFDRYGDWHYFRHVFRLAWRSLRDPTAVNRFARDYWYGDVR